MDIIEITRTLGSELQQDERYIRYAVAKQKNDEDKELQDLIGQLNLIRVNYHSEASKKDRDQDRLKELNEEYQNVYNMIMSNPNMKEYNSAKQVLDQLLAYVQGIISMSANGSDPQTCEPPAEGCGSDCSSCDGCG